jgi:hypothetical protein
LGRGAGRAAGAGWGWGWGAGGGGLTAWVSFSAIQAMPPEKPKKATPPQTSVSTNSVASTIEATLPRPFTEAGRAMSGGSGGSGGGAAGLGGAIGGSSAVLVRRGGGAGEGSGGAIGDAAGAGGGAPWGGREGSGARRSGEGQGLGGPALGGAGGRRTAFLRAAVVDDLGEGPGAGREGGLRL